MNARETRSPGGRGSRGGGGKKGGGGRGGKGGTSRDTAPGCAIVAIVGAGLMLLAGSSAAGILLAQVLLRAAQ